MLIKFPRVHLLIALAAAIIGLSPTISHAHTSIDRVNFTIGFNGLSTDLKTFMATVMPGGKIDFTTKAFARSESGKISRRDKGWEWKAPHLPGRYELFFEKDNETILLQVFVLTPYHNTETGTLNGYKIGTYRKTLFRELSSYSAPKGFINLADGPADLAISPNFTLGQFICKQQPGHNPTYLLVRPETLIKLETLLEAANKEGWRAETLHVMSGFRTPYYNRSIGNRTTSSRHLYGGAADVWIDGDDDELMDDLNRDGKIDTDDARALAHLAERLAKVGGRNWPVGGIGVYSANTARGPFIHIDSRGYRARW